MLIAPWDQVTRSEIENNFARSYHTHYQYASKDDVDIIKQQLSEVTENLKHLILRFDELQRQVLYAQED